MEGLGRQYCQQVRREGFATLYHSSSYLCSFYWNRALNCSLDVADDGVVTLYITNRRC